MLDCTHEQKVHAWPAVGGVDRRGHAVKYSVHGACGSCQTSQSVRIDQMRICLDLQTDRQINRQTNWQTDRTDHFTLPLAHVHRVMYTWGEGGGGGFHVACKPLPLPWPLLIACMHTMPLSDSFSAIGPISPLSRLLFCLLNKKRGGVGLARQISLCPYPEWVLIVVAIPYIFAVACQLC
jgi:hypothetical protein